MDTRADASLKMYWLVLTPALILTEKTLNVYLSDFSVLATGYRICTLITVVSRYHHRIHVLLSLCFSLCLTHGYMPLDMIKTTIVPVIKNKCGNLADSNNYRPIAIATIVSKLYESTFLYKCKEFLKTCDNQFGFKRKHSTEFCIYTLKEFIDYYKQRGTTIFVTFLDGSKAFDKIDFWLLFQKLITKGFPVFIIKILAYWYCYQEMHDRWGSTSTSSFHVSNGVKQGGILSPMLFKVYMDQLSIRLNRSGIGGGGGILEVI